MKRLMRMSVPIAALAAIMALTGCPKATVEITVNFGDLVVGETGQLTAASTNSKDTIEWTSSDDEVATVDQDGLVTGVAAGSATITATGSQSGASDDTLVQVNEPVIDPNKLNAISITGEPAVDGVAESFWADAPTLSVPLGETFDVHDPSSIMDCTGCHAFDSAVTVDLKAAYTTDRIYILAKWLDPTASFTRGGSWSFVDDAWQKLTPEQSEDRIALFWPVGDIVGAPFDTGGCMAKCHAYYPTDTDPHVSTHGIVDDAWLESGLGDMWHTKAARGASYLSASGTGLTVNSETHEVVSGTYSMTGFADDKYVGVWEPDDINGEDGGRYGDAGTSAYSHNRIGDKSRPKYMEMAPADYADAMTLTQDEIDGGQCVGNSDTGVTDADAATYWPAYASLSAIVPERILRMPDGSRSDIDFGAVWSNGVWTVELARDLNTGTGDDVQFSTLSEYLFGVAAFENSRHGYEHRTSDMYYLKFIE